MGFKKMSRLIAFGCSFTYGQGLPGCIIGNTKNDFAKFPSKKAWPTILGDLLDIDVINKGQPGASNREILFHVLNFNFCHKDIAVLMWTLPNRDLYFIKNKKPVKPFRQLGLWRKGKDLFANYWLRKTTDFDNSIKSWFHMHHAELYLKSKGIRFIHFPIFPHELEKYKPDYIGLSNYFNSGFEYIDKCIKDNHPGIESHKNTAKNLYRIINEQR